mmetsp:Transcript_24586/g.80348  ORF Transcript_24586/g.80348 Transcript_24586/m.80348 type:complete len:373 (-) Transcript_24586:882-2000(-)
MRRWRSGTHAPHESLRLHLEPLLAGVERLRLMEQRPQHGRALREWLRLDPCEDRSRKEGKAHVREERLERAEPLLLGREARAPAFAHPGFENVEQVVLAEDAQGGAGDHRRHEPERSAQNVRARVAPQHRELACGVLNPCAPNRLEVRGVAAPHLLAEHHRSDDVERREAARDDAAAFLHERRHLQLFGKEEERQHVLVRRWELSAVKPSEEAAQGGRAHARERDAPLRRFSEPVREARLEKSGARHEHDTMSHEPLHCRQSCRVVSRALPYLLHHRILLSALALALAHTLHHLLDFLLVILLLLLILIRLRLELYILQDAAAQEKARGAVERRSLGARQKRRRIRTGSSRDVDRFEKRAHLARGEAWERHY